MKGIACTEASFLHQPVHTHLSLLLPSKRCCAQNLKHHSGSLSSGEEVGLIISSQKPNHLNHS